MSSSSPSLRSRFVGALIGTMAGDQLGAPFEGQPGDVVASRMDGSNRSAADWIQLSRYTDDTQMMIGLAESLAALGRLDGADVARRFAENYEPDRGYGGGAHRVLSALRDGCAWDQAATLVFPDGSFGNGAAMRVAPVGVFFWRDRAARRQAAEASAVVTHAHPLGMEGAVLQAHAIAEAISAVHDGFTPAAFIASLATDTAICGKSILISRFTPSVGAFRPSGSIRSSPRPAARPTSGSRTSWT